jgi:hypothetical protein
MQSKTYRLIAQAMAERQQVLCLYEGFARALCPIVLGRSKGEERLLAYQFAGGASQGLPPQGQWKCLQLSKMSEVELRRGRWHAGSSHKRPQGCVSEVDLDVNPKSPYRPRRRLGAPSRRSE